MNVCQNYVAEGHILCGRGSTILCDRLFITTKQASCWKQEL